MLGRRVDSYRQTHCWRITWRGRVCLSACGPTLVEGGEPTQAGRLGAHPRILAGGQAGRLTADRANCTPTLLRYMEDIARWTGEPSLPQGRSRARRSKVPPCRAEKWNCHPALPKRSISARRVAGCPKLSWTNNTKAGRHCDHGVGAEGRQPHGSAGEVVGVELQDVVQL